MDAERWKKIENIFQSALDLTGAEREEFISAECGDDDELRREIEKLIARFETEDSFLESPVWTDSRFLQSEVKREIAKSLDDEISPRGETEKSLIGQRVGVFELTEELGKGGMGMVYLGVRADGEFRQKVAIKLIKRGMDTDFIIKRFRQERQILANLNHPNIARLIDGGTTSDGLSYFVMELVEGVPVIKYGERQKLDVRRKLETFLQICRAIIYAHKRGIIHRDIKPSNILIDEDGTPKLLDFGIAKILDPDSIHESVSPTATQMRLMTPEYASPEQARGEEITPASDQYSLGVLLYELLTGNRPYKFPSRAPHEIARVICEEMPSEPSSGKFGLTEKDAQFDENFCEQIDRIVLKALRKNPSERFKSVEEFAENVEKFLRGEKITAENFAEQTKYSEIGRTVGENQSRTDVLMNYAGENFPPNNFIKSAPTKVKSVSPRRKGIKQGIFVSILAFFLIPVLIGLTATGSANPVFCIVIFFLIIFGGIARVIYALLFEEKQQKIFDLSKAVNNEIGEAQTKLINSPAKGLTAIENDGKITAEEIPSGEKSIAVLPFKNLNTLSDGTTGGGEFLSIGLADALITRLSNVKKLVVRPTSSILLFGAAETDVFAAGEELKVEYILTGNILRAEKKIRVSIQLLDIKKKASVWAKRFDENFTDVLEIEDLISANVVELLLPHLTGADRRQVEKRGTDNAKAHEAYLRGRFYRNMFSDENLSKAYAAYREAISLDPDYALAYAGIADYYIWLGVNGVVAPTDAYPLAKDAARRAIELDDHLADAYASLAFAQICGDYDWIEAEKNAARAVALAPNYSVARLWYSYVLLTSERFDEALVQAKRAVELDPLTYVTHHVLALNYFMARRFDEALAQAAENVKNFAGIGMAFHFQSWILRNTGNYEDALTAVRRTIELSGDSLFLTITYAQTLAAARRRAETEELLQSIFEQGERQYLSYYQIALIYVYLDEKENALDALERAFEDREGWLIWLRIEPALDKLRREPRFVNLRKKIDRRSIGGNDVKKVEVISDSKISAD